MSPLCPPAVLHVPAHLLLLFADLIIVLKDGQVEEQGTHEELMRAGGLYYSMWQQQVSDISADAALPEAATVTNAQP